jgi:RHS repeat-associated protein
VSQFGSASYSFDTEGQTLSKTDSTGTTQYAWDARGRLSRVNLPNGKTVSYGYDPLGRRASRTDDSGTTTFLYDGADVAVDKNGGSESEYINGPGIDNKLRQSGTSGSIFFLHDHLGSTIGLTNGAGTTVERDSYDPYGNSPGGSATRYGFTGRERDDATGLIYFRARWYDPQQGRFITEDPAGYGGGANVYAYANGNPVNFTDPTGLGLDDLIAKYDRVVAPVVGSIKSGIASAGQTAKEILVTVGGYVDAANRAVNVELLQHPTAYSGLRHLMPPPPRQPSPPPQPGSRRKVPCDNNDWFEKAYGNGVKIHKVAQDVAAVTDLIKLGWAAIAERFAIGAVGLSGGLTSDVESGLANDEAMKANLASGQRPLPGYVNIDKEIGLPIDVRADLTDGIPLADASVGEVMGTRFPGPLLGTYGEQTAREAYRVLQPGGKLIINSNTLPPSFADELAGAGFRNIRVSGGTVTAVK